MSELREQLACDDGNVYLERLRAGVRRQVIEKVIAKVREVSTESRAEVKLKWEIIAAIRGIR